MDLKQADNQSSATAKQDDQIEILLFGLGEEAYGINVAKVREVIRQCRVTPAPEQHFAVLGMIDLRGHVLPLVDLHRMLGSESTAPDEAKRIVVTEFYGTSCGFLVDRVAHIRRVKVEDIRSMKESLQDETAVNSIAELEDQLVMMLDFEAIIEQLDSRHEMSRPVKEAAPISGVDRSQLRIFLAEDSQTICRQIQMSLASGGYTQVTAFDNGRSCWEAIEAGRGSSGQSPCDLLISDIEMPQMDGYGLCQRVKGDAGLSDLPVFLFSSMISDRTRMRGEALGADEQITKPQLPELVSIIDRWASKLADRRAA